MSDERYNIVLRDCMAEGLYEVFLKGSKVLRINHFNGPHDLKGDEVTWRDLPSYIQQKLVEEVQERMKE
jgi:hypothetical protein